MSARSTFRLDGRAAAIAVEQLERETGRRHVDEVVEDVDCDVLRSPFENGRCDFVLRQRVKRAAPDRGEVRRRREPRRDAERSQNAARHAPAGSIAPVDEIAEASVGGAVVERLDPERFRSGLGGCRRDRAAAQLRLERARGRHRGRAGDPGDDALADALCKRRQLHDAITSSRSVERAPSRSIRWSPTRSAFAIAVSAGLTALEDGKKLVSTTYRLSRSCALQLTSSADVSGWCPKRTVPHWWATPATGIRSSRIIWFGINVG